MDNEQYPRYIRISVDIARRITQGDFAENQKIKGRSTLAGEYGVSPETIRRSAALLSDMGVVSVIDKSGIMVVSKNKAYDFVDKFSSKQTITSLKLKIKDLMTQRDQINTEIVDKFDLLLEQLNSQESLNKIAHYSHKISDSSKVIGSTLAGLQFWQNTGATVIAVKRKDDLLISPGPYFALAEDDVIYFVGVYDVKSKVHKFIEE